MKRLIHAVLVLIAVFALSVQADWESDHPECAITPEIQELARSLDNDPLKIYNWVYNNIDFELYPGCRRGALSTLLCKRGNDLDQCALLMALLRCSGVEETNLSYIAINAKYDRQYISNIFSQGYDNLFDNYSYPTYHYFYFFGMQNGFLSSEPNTIRVKHHLVKATINSTDYYLDPSFTPYQLEEPPFDIETTMGLSASELTNALWNGATASSDGSGIKNANFDALSDVFSHYASNLTVAVKAQCPNISADALFSAGRIIPRELNSLPTALPEETVGRIVNGPTELTMLDSNHYAKITLKITSGTASWTHTFLGPEIVAKRLTLEFDSSNKSFVYLDGTLVTNGSFGTTFILTRAIPIEDGTLASSFYGPNLQSKTMTGGGNGRYALAHSFGDDSPGVLAYHQKRLAQAYANGASQTSEQIWGGALNLMNLSYNLQESMPAQLLSHVCRKLFVKFCCIGRAAAENYYFVDMNGTTAVGNPYDHDIFTLGIFYGSAFENAVVEQMQGSDNPGISSARGVYYNNQQGKYTFFATPSTWNSVKPQLNANMASIATLQNRMDNYSTYEVLTPAENACADPSNTSAWKGYVYFDYLKSGVIATVSATIGSANGGYASYPSYFNPAPVYTRSFDVYVPKFSFQTETFRPISFDPIDLYSGSFLSDSADLLLPGAGGQPIRMNRSYNAGQASKESLMGYGWGHSCEVKAVETSHGEKITSFDSSPYELIPAIVATMCGKNLIAAGHNLNSFMVSALSANWLVDQAVDNVVVVTEGNGSKEFVRRSDGTYLAPKNSKEQLTKNPDGSFVLEKPFGETITFGTNGLALSWLNADGTGLTFSNETATVGTNHVDRLKKVTDSYGRYFSFSYNATNLLTNVVDSTGRSVTYGYDTNKNLTTFTDAENKTWTYHYDSKHQLTYITDPMSRMVVSNSYNALGQVTNQVSAIDESWQYAYGGTHTLEINPYSATNTYLFDDLGRESGRIDQLGNQTRKEYDGQNHLTASVTASGVTNLFFYDANHNMTNKVEAVGTAQERATQLVYDDQHHLMRTVDAMGYMNYFGYDDEHHLTGTTNALGHTTSKTYYPNGLLHTATDANDNTVTYTYDSYGNPDIITYPGNREQDLDFDIRGNLLVSRDLNGNPTTKTYDKRGLVTSITDAKGLTITNTYTATGKLFETWPVGHEERKVTYTYTSSDQIESITHPNGGVVSNVYDELDRLYAVKDVRGYWTTNQYDAVGRVTNTINALNQAVSSTYDAIGNVLTVTDPLGTVSNLYDALSRPVRVYHSQDGYTACSETVYDPLDRVTAQFDRNGHLVSTNTYDAIGRIRWSEDQLGNRTGYGYDNNGNVTSVTNARESVSRLFYDGMNNCTGTVDQLDHRTAYTYDDQGNLLTVTDPLEHTVSNAYNQLNQLVMTVDAAGSTNRFGYDAFGNPSVTTNARGFASSVVYDAMNNAVTNIAPIGRQSFTYDKAGNLKTQTDPLSHTTSHDYDPLDRLETVTRPDQNTEGYGYDPLGNMNRFSNARNIETTFGYDALGLRTNLQSAIGNQHFSYDPAGNLTNAVDELERPVKYTYDSINRLKRIDWQDSTFAAFGYDENNNLTGLSNQVSGVSLAYNLIDQLTNSLISLSSLSSFAVNNSYDSNGNLTNTVLTASTISTPLTIGYAYDGAGQVTSIDLSTFGLSTFDFHYDENGNLTNILYPNGVTASRVYDAGDRLQSFAYSTNGTPFLQRSFIRDLLGQKKVEDVNAGTLFKPSVTIEQTRENNTADQLTSVSTTNSTESFTYNGTGCLTNVVQASLPAVSYEYDQANRLIRVDSGDSWAEYLYDASGSCIGRIAGVPPAAVTNYYVLNYSDPLKRPIAETDASGNVTRVYVWGPSGLLAHIDTVAGVLDPGSVRFYHSDELGSTLALTDEDGTVTDEFGYTPYGEQLGHIGSTQTPYRWLAGLGVRVEDEAQQLFYMNRRFYSASLKRFLTRDPSGLDGGPNAYLYASANPLFFVDPSGLCPETSFNVPSSFSSSSWGFDQNSFAGIDQIKQDYHNYQMQNNASYYDQQTYVQAPKTPVSQQVYSFAASATGAKALTEAITGYGVNSDGSYNFSKTYTSNQRLGLAAQGTLQAATFVWGSAQLGAVGGTAFSSSSRAVASSFSRNSYSSLPQSFSKMVSKGQADVLRAGGTIDLAGANGAGFIGSADELAGITTSHAMKRAMGVRYNPDYLLEFQLKDTTGLQNLLEYNDPLWRYGGKTINGFSEFNMPGLNSDNIMNWTLRRLK